MRIRSKLLILMAVPILAVMFAAGLGFRSQNVAALKAASAEESVQQSALVHNALSAITLERLSELGATDMAADHELHEATELALGDLANFAADSSNSALADAVKVAQEQVSQGHLATDMIGTLDAYSGAYAAIIAVPSDLTDTLPTNETLIQNLATDLVIAGTEEQSAAWFHYLSAPSATDADTAAIIRDFSLSRQAFTHSRGIDPSMATTNIATMNTLGILETVALDDLAEGELSLGTSEILPELVAFSQEWADTIANRDAVLSQAIADESAQVKNIQSLFTLLAIVGTVVLAGLVFVIYRSINDPLATLLVRANAVANEELPNLVETLRDPDGVENLPQLTLIEKQGNDEIGELIEAFNGVQGTAYQLAIEQAVSKRNAADMFVNFGRRNQMLLQRMLSIITGLELDEEDPQALQELFQLDNIVTRMRRNAESLLILAGSQTARQWSAPVDISDTVRAAFGEVESYERIEIVALTDVKVQGGAVSDIAHLLAELLENALSFSEGSTPVLVSGQFENGGYLITIFDQGIGMNMDELEEANQRITDPPALDRAPTRFLGLFVVGRLADRHGITARLIEAPGRGLMARVHLPREILVTEADLAETVENAALSGPSDSSPLETDQNIDAEWEGFASEELPERPISSAVDEEPSNEPSPEELLPTASVVDEDLTDDLVVKSPILDPIEDLEFVDSSTEPDDLAALPTRRRGEALNEDVVAEAVPSTFESDNSPGAATDFSSMMSALSTGISRGLEDSVDGVDGSGDSVGHSMDSANDEWSNK